MHAIFFTLASLLCKGSGKQMPWSAVGIPLLVKRQKRQSLAKRQASVLDGLNPLRVLSILALAFNPAVAFNPCGPGASLPACNPYLSVRSLDDRHGQGRLGAAVVMNDAQDGDDLEKLTVVALKQKMRELGLRVSGKKADLIARLRENAAPGTVSSEKDSDDESIPSRSRQDLKESLRSSLQEDATKESLIATLDEHAAKPEEDDNEQTKSDQQPSEKREKTKKRFNSYNEVVDEALRRQTDMIYRTSSSRLRGKQTSKVNVTGLNRLVLMDVLAKHPKAQEKIGSGVDHIFVANTSYGSLAFHVARTDGSVTDFSYKKALGLK